jgi:ADP-ribose pyrophosphatase YjhB (NUDIX family)
VCWDNGVIEADWRDPSLPWSLAAGSQLLADLPQLLQVFAATVERGYPSREIRPLADGEELPLEVAGGQWRATWHPPTAAPEGQRHGACGVCIAEGGQVVLISADGLRWDLPAGRTEGAESWEETLRREMREEACATVVQARLLGFAQSRCLSGPQAGLVLVRSFWRAEVALDPWQPQFEIAHRRLVEPGALAPLLPPLYARILARALTEARIELRRP